MTRSRSWSGMVAALLVLGACTAGDGQAAGRGPGQPTHAPTAAGVAVGPVRTLAGMTVPRAVHTATLLRDGTVLVASGSDERDNAGLYHSAELFDPGTGRFQPTGDLRGARYKPRSTSMLLRDGRVLVAGGASGPEVYQPRIGGFAPLAGSLGWAPLFAAAVLLPDGGALLCGGYSLTGPASNAAWLIRP